MTNAATAAIWPAYLALLAYVVAESPWPIHRARPLAAALGATAVAVFLVDLTWRVLREGGYADAAWNIPRAVSRQVVRSTLLLLGAGLVFLLPQAIVGVGALASNGRPVEAPAACRLLTIGFEVFAWGLFLSMIRRESPLVQWFTPEPTQSGWISRNRRAASIFALGTAAFVIVLDARGYHHTARRLAVAGFPSIAWVFACRGLDRLARRAIADRAWRWDHAARDDGGGTPEGAALLPEDLAGRLGQVLGLAIPCLAALGVAWIWDVDSALFRSIAEWPLWVEQDVVRLSAGDVIEAVVVFFLTAWAWRHMSTFFALVVFPRMGEDPGVRFAVLTLCRYAVLAAGLLVGLTSVRVDLAQIGVVLAALGVGLGFGLQEIVANFVSGIILLLERPIRVGDLVSVSGMTGQVEQINIRATTINNFDNHSLVIPNRAFITGNLVNWTLKDKVVRGEIQIQAAYGTDPDKVADLLLTIARDDADVLRNPVPSAYMESFGDSALNFIFYYHVPDPSLSLRVKHRLFAEIQRRFDAAGIEIPFPIRELRIDGETLAPGRATPLAVARRYDPPSVVPPPPTPPAKLALPKVESYIRCVDE